MTTTSETRRLALAVVWLNGVVMGFGEEGSYVPPFTDPGIPTPRWHSVRDILPHVTDETRFELWIQGIAEVVPLSSEAWVAIATRLEKVANGGTVTRRWGVF